MSEIDKIINDGKRAGQLLADPVLRSQLDAIVKTELDKIIGSSPAQVEVRETAYHTIHAVQRLEMALSTTKNNGVYEEEKIKRRRN